jgi:hypothetical protein
VDKLPGVRPEVAGLRHADGSALWLADRGYPELGPVICGHPVTRLADGEWFEQWLAEASPEALIVSYADKRAGQRLESMAERFASWAHRYPPADRASRSRDSWTVETVELIRQRSERLERLACEIAAVRPSQLARLHWTARTIASVRGAAQAMRSGARAAEALQSGARPAEAKPAERPIAP